MKLTSGEIVEKLTNLNDAFDKLSEEILLLRNEHTNLPDKKLDTFTDAFMFLTKEVKDLRDIIVEINRDR